MAKKFVSYGLITLIAITFIISCAQENSASNMQPVTLPWEEAYGKFYTRDIARAEEEVSFTLILPTYIPKMQGDMPLPGLVGLLKEYQHDNKAWVDIYYGVDYARSVTGIIYINEYIDFTTSVA